MSRAGRYTGTCFLLYFALPGLQRLSLALLVAHNDQCGGGGNQIRDNLYAFVDVIQYRYHCRGGFIVPKLVV